MDRWKQVLLAGRIEADDLPAGHRPQPLADIALVEVGRLGDLLAGGPVHGRHRVEEPSAVTDAHEHSQQALVDHVDHPLTEGR
jgi:hypothetical protein